jgi:hypothetical protein
MGTLLKNRTHEYVLEPASFRLFVKRGFGTEDDHLVRSVAKEEVPLG